MALYSGPPVKTAYRKIREPGFGNSDFIEVRVTLKMSRQSPSQPPRNGRL